MADYDFFEDRDDQRTDDSSPFPADPIIRDGPLAGQDLPQTGTVGDLTGRADGGDSGGVPQDWLKDFLSRNPGDEARAKSAYESNNTSKTNIPGMNDEQTRLFRSLNPEVPGQFTDPIASYLEQFAQKRASERENPSAGSGQALLEEALRNISAQFGKGGFTPGENEVFQTQALDPLERLRTARKQQVLQQLAQRGIPQSSGVAIQMLADVDRQFDAQRATTQRSLAGQAAQETQARMLQAVQLLSGLAGTENQRLNEGYQYRQVPLQLADRSFTQANQFLSAQGNPLAGLSGYGQLAGMQQGRSDASQAALADLIYALLQAGGG